MIIPTETGWTYTLEEDHISGNTSVFQPTKTESSIQKIKINTTYTTTLKIMGTGVDSLYERMSTIAVFQPFIGGVLKPIEKNFNYLSIMIDTITRDYPTEAALLLETFFALIETEFEATIVAIKPYILQVLEDGVQKRPSLKTGISKISLLGMTSQDNAPLTLSLQPGPHPYSGSSVWQEKITRNSFGEEVCCWRPLDRFLALKEIILKKQTLGMILLP